MFVIRKAKDRGTTNLSWLESYHTFSFGNYFDPEQMSFGSLRVINDDRILPGAGFGTHSHDNMEIVSYVLEGALEHRDSLGNGSVIIPGDVQRMSAGKGIQHSEFNGSKTQPTHFLQIWFIPQTRNILPSYEQKHFSALGKKGPLLLVGSPSGRDGSLTINQDVDMYAARIHHQDAITHELRAHRKAWLQVARGEIKVNGMQLQEGDGVATNDPSIILKEGHNAEVILFDIAADTLS